MSVSSPFRTVAVVCGEEIDDDCFGVGVTKIDSGNTSPAQLEKLAIITLHELQAIVSTSPDLLLERFVSDC